MSSVRVTVEWLFGNIINDFKFFKNWHEQCWKNVSSLCSPSQYNNLLMKTAPLSFLGLITLPDRTTSDKSNALNEFMSVKVNIHNSSAS